MELTVQLEEWFLTADERGNPSATVDPWTEGNDVVALAHGASYFAELATAVAAAGPGDQLHFTDWRGDADQRLTLDGPTVAAAFADASRRGVDVRGLVWRSHSDRLSFNSRENRHLADAIDASGAEVVLDERVRRGGSHHQKLVVVRHPTDGANDVAFVGGIDLCHGRRDDASHVGDDQPMPIDVRYGQRPPWHDIQLRVQGPAVGDLDRTFRERWNDPTPLDHSGRVRALGSHLTSRERRSRPLPPALPDPPPAGVHAVQVLRTYPVRRPRYPFAPNGERSVARAFRKAVERARQLVYLEDQYFWSADIAEILADALRRRPHLQLIVVLPRFPDQDGILSGPPARLAQRRAIDIVCQAGGDRVGFFDIENDEGTPVYVHAKAGVIDDVWATVGSDNLNRRSWTHDSEVACAVLDETIDGRNPVDPGGLGDGARRFARDLRVHLWAEHLRLDPNDSSLFDTANAVAQWRDAASGAGRVREHDVESVPPSFWDFADVVNRLLFDPDGRRLADRRRGQF